MNSDCTNHVPMEDESRGITICMNCGHVIEASHLRMDVSFDSRQRLVGRNFNVATGLTSALMRDPEQQRLRQTQKLLEGIASQLELSKQVVEAGQRIFLLAQKKGFTQGRSLNVVAGACLYIACRKQKQPHLLVDFSDVLKKNMYLLASYYMKLLRCLDMEVPLVDPSIFIHKFCAKLEFEGKQNKVAKTALRLMQSMNREWMGTGRRPNGLCGAAILIAARYHGFKRSTTQVVKVVHVCDETIRKRLDEFKSSSVGQLTYHEFQEWEPPKLIRDICKKDLEIDNEAAVVDMMHAKAEEIEQKIGQTGGQLILPEVAEQPQLLAIKQDSMHSSLSNLKEEFSEELKHPQKDSLSSDEDEELKQIILTEEEKKLKTLLWNSLNKDWIKEQREKKLKLKKEAVKAKGNKRKRRTKKDLQELYSQCATPAESIKSSLKGSRLNPAFIDKMMARDNSGS